MFCIEAMAPRSYERSSITPVSMGLHSIKKTSKEVLHVLTQPAATTFCQGVSIYDGITGGQQEAEISMAMQP